MTPVLAALSGFALVALALAVVWAVQLKTRNAGMVDPVWSWSMGFLAVWYAIFGSAAAETRLALGLLGGIWGLRLGSHLFIRNAGKPEDARYAKFRAEWGAKANFNMFWFFQFQALVAWALSVGFLVVAYRPGDSHVTALGLGVAIWLIAVIGESVADAQMERFRTDPSTRGQVMDRGLWRYSRHPNYFFESLHWVAYLPLAFGSPYGWVTLLPAVLMAWLLLKMSGVPILEAHLVQSRPGYADYMRRTSVFIPWPPKS